MAQNAANAFADVFKNAGWSGWDFNQLFSASRRNLEVLTAANQVLAQGFQEAARRQSQIAQSNAEEAIQLFKEIYSSKSPDMSATKQANFAKSAIETAVANARETFEVLQKANAEAAEILGDRVKDAWAEMAKSGSSSSKKNS